MSKKPLLIVGPYPQFWGNIFTDQDRQRLEEMVSIKYSGDDKMADVVFDSALPDAGAVVEQIAMPKERLKRAKKLKLIFNSNVWPSEPMSADHPARSIEDFLLSPHRAGASHQAFHKIEQMLVDDLHLILKHLPPARTQPARRETVAQFCSYPAG